MIIPNLLIIAGTGNASGKTSMACRIIEQLVDQNVYGVKITPHYHDITPGLDPVKEASGYSIFRETNRELSKDTSRMLRAGAAGVYFAKVEDNSLPKAFNWIMRYIPEGSPVICESPALRYYVEPGLFIIMTSSDEHNKININKLLDLPHVEFNLSSLQSEKSLPIIFDNGRWFCAL
jgi:hypothetical protein